MGIVINSTTPSAIRVGPDDVSAVYVGDTQVWPVAGASYDPDAIPGLLFRMDAIDNPPAVTGTQVTSWTGADPSAAVFSQSDASRRPSYDPANGDFLQFDVDWLEGSGLGIDGDATYFVVAGRDATSQNALILQGGPTASRNQISYGNSTGAWGLNANGAGPTLSLTDTDTHIWTAVFAGANSAFTADGDVASQATGSNGTATPGDTTFYIGWGFRSTPGQFAFEGRISALYAVDGAVSAATQREIEGYLAHKFGLAGNLPASHPFKSAPPTG